MFCSRYNLFWKVHFGKPFQTPKTNTKQALFWPNFVQNYIRSFFNFAGSVYQSLKSSDSRGVSYLTSCEDFWTGCCPQQGHSQRQSRGLCATHAGLWEKGYLVLVNVSFGSCVYNSLHIVRGMFFDIYGKRNLFLNSSVFSVHRTQHVSADQWWSPDRAPLHVSSPSPPHVSGCRGNWCHWSPGCSSSHAQWWGQKWWAWSCPYSSQSPGGIWPEKTNRQQYMRQETQRNCYSTHRFKVNLKLKLRLSDIF